MRPSLRRTILGGVIGTILMTLMMYFVSPVVIGHRMDIAGSLGSMMWDNWYLGMMAHVAIGAGVLPLVFAYIVYGVLPGAPWLKGLLCGLILWVMAQVVVMPMMGGGIFSSRMGGMPAAMGSLIGHCVYGLALGFSAGEPAHEQAPRTV
jgi:hypothetical protein